MTDAFLTALGESWRGQRRPFECARRVRRQHLVSLLLFAGEVIGAVVGVAAGGWLLARGLGPYSALGRLAGAVLITAPPLLALASWRVRQALPPLECETAEGVLLHTLRRLGMVERLVALGAWHAYVLAAFACALAILALAGWTPRDWIVGGYCAFYLLVAIGMRLWVARRRRQIARETAGCRALLAEFTGAGV